jgi:hypothetical protein
MTGIRSKRESEARIDPSAVDQHRTRAALSTVATLLGAGQVKPFAKKIEQRDPWIVQRNVSRCTIHGQRYR